MMSRSGQLARTPSTWFRGAPEGARLRVTSFRTVALTLLLSVTGLAGCQVGRSQLAGRGADEWTRSYTLKDGGEFQIVGAVGTIDIQGSDAATIDVKAERIVRSSTDAIAQEAVSRIRITEDVTPDKVILRNDGLGGIVVGVDVTVNFHVSVPRATRLRLRTAGGNITVANVNGTIVASTTNGSITGTALGGGVEARATNGGVTIDLAAVGQDPVELRVTNGSVALTVPPTANANLEASCTNGTIDIADLPLQETGEQSKRKTRGRLNAGGAPIDLTTTNGNIKVRPRP